MGKGVLLGIVLGVIGVFLGAYLYFSTGQAPVAVTSPEMPFESKFARMAQHAYMSKKPHLPSSVPEDEANLGASRESLQGQLRRLPRIAWRAEDGYCRRYVPETTAAVSRGRCNR